MRSGYAPVAVVRGTRTAHTDAALRVALRGKGLVRRQGLDLKVLGAEEPSADRRRSGQIIQLPA